MLFIIDLHLKIAMVKGVSDEGIGDHQRVQFYLKTLVSHFVSFGKPKEAEQAPLFSLIGRHIQRIDMRKALCMQPVLHLS